MKTFTAFLFALLFCSNVVADNAGRTKGVYDQEKLKKDIVVYRKELEKCDKNFDEMAHKAYSTAEMVESIYSFVNCCKVLTEKIIDEQYSKRAEEQKSAYRIYSGSISHQQHYLSNCRCLPSKMRYHVHRNRKRYRSPQSPNNC